MNGQLGISAKIATDYKKTFQAKDYENKWIICIYNGNYKDEIEVLKIRNKLRELGFFGPLCYKIDEATTLNKYGHTSHKIFKRK